MTTEVFFQYHEYLLPVTPTIVRDLWELIWSDSEALSCGFGHSGSRRRLLMGFRVWTRFGHISNCVGINTLSDLKLSGTWVTALELLRVTRVEHTIAGEGKRGQNDNTGLF